LCYNGGKIPGRTHKVKQFAWVKKPRTFEAVIHASKYGPAPVQFSVAKCISLTRITL
jgi:hypothetical protein